MIEFLCISYAVFVISSIIVVYKLNKEIVRVDERSAQRYRFSMDEIHRVERNIINVTRTNISKDVPEKVEEVFLKLPVGVNRSLNRKRVVSERNKRGQFKKIKRQLRSLS